MRFANVFALLPKHLQARSGDVPPASVVFFLMHRYPYSETLLSSTPTEALAIAGLQGCPPYRAYEGGSNKPHLKEGGAGDSSFDDLLINQSLHRPD